MLLKYKTLLIITFILLIFILQITSAKENKIVITIDPGHGGRDPGAIYNNIYEKDINLSISKKLKKELEKNKYKVYLIRDKDIDLSNKYDIKKKRSDLYRRLLKIKEYGSNIYLSIHLNWYKNSYYRGAEVLYNPINTKNKLLAQYIQEEFNNKLNSTRHITKTGLYIYKNTTVPGVLIECGFLSNSFDRNSLLNKTYQEKLVKVITKGVNTYIKNLK